MKSGKFAITIVVLSFALLVLSFADVVIGANMQSDSYRIDMGNLNMGAGSPSSDSYNLGLTMGQIAPGRYESTGYIVRAGFQYIHSIIPFTFSISDISIDFGSLIPQTPSTQTNTLTVSAGGAGGYQVTAAEFDTLKTAAEAVIPDTSCDGNGNTCTETQAKVWSLNAAYGFGYNLSGDDIPSDFIDSTYYRRFPSNAEAESPAVVMSNTNVGRNRQATVTYKVNISSTQEAGEYHSIITFVATPTF